jgi:hypothetical protein
VAPRARDAPLPRRRGRAVRWLMQMRTGACAAVGGWRKPHATNPNHDPCPLCGRQQNRDSVPHPVTHFLACDGNAEVTGARVEVGRKHGCDLTQAASLWSSGEAMLEWIYAVAPIIARAPSGPGPP